MKILLLSLFVATTTLCCAQDQEKRLKNYNLDEGLALDGYDPVSYFSGKAIEGKKQIAVLHKGIKYYFATPANKSAFIADPDKYEPAYGGWCAFAMGESGEKVKVDPETFKIINGKVYLFYNFWGNNTLEDWNDDEAQLKSSADKQWKKYVNP
jgi:YHS domain-containing protein